MSNSEPSKADVSRPAVSTTSGREWRIMAVFFVFLVGYAALYLQTEVGPPGSPPRYQLLGVLTVLPELYLSKWFGDPPSLTLLDRVPVLAWATAILSAAWLLGSVPLRLGGLHCRLSRFEKLIFSVAVGANVISLFVLLVGLMGALNPFAFVALGGAIAAAAAYCVLDWRRAKTLAHQPHRNGLEAASGLGSTGRANLDKPELDSNWLWLGVPFVLVIVLGGMLPPVDFDVREYHLQAPKEFYQAGRISFLPHNVYGNMPLGCEMFSLLAMVLVGDWWQGALIGKTVIAAFAPLTALALLSAGTRFGSRTAGVVAALVYISIPWISQVSTAGLVEGVSAFYLWAAVYAVLLWRQAEKSESVGPVVLAGFLAGAAVSCKYPAALFVAVPLTAWVWLAGWRPNWKATALFVLACAVGCAPWFIKNWVLTGNPTYPLLYEIFGGASRTDANNSQWLRIHSPHGFSLRHLATSLSQVAWRSEWISPIVVPLAALAWLAPVRRRRLAFPLFAFFTYVIAAWWLCTHRIDRFWIPALPVIAILAGFGATWSASVAWRRMLLATLLCGLAVNWLFVISGPGGYNAYFVGLEQLRYDTARADYWHVYLNHNVPPGYKVLTVGDCQVFDLEMPVLYNTVFDDSVFEKIYQDQHGIPEKIRAELDRLRVSHVYVNWLEIRRYREPGNYGFPSSIDHRLFEELVAAGVFEPPLNRKRDHGQVFPVRKLDP
ncbi:MAG TPA: hypothetical protein VND64_06595 [Pirellulales bacterium]|nr:hypothetical protein [Pirellulales bacterium]